MVLAGVAALEGLAPGTRVWVVGAGATVAYAEALGLVPDTDAPEVVVLTRDTGFTYQRLQQVLAHLHRGARLVAANGDATHPGADGVPVPETGALLSAIHTCMPGLEVEVLGKPYPSLFKAALTRLSATADQAVMIGDNPATDGAGAKAAGVDFIQIGEGQGARYRTLAELVAAE